MIGDIFVGALLLISGFVNVLAIGAFWITPSLRTTANRFVINLLLVNFISCLILTPFAFNVNVDSPTTSSIASFAANRSYNTSISVVEVDNNNNSSFSSNKTVECSNRTLSCIEIPDKFHLLENNFPLRKYQAWSLDLVVAMSVLSVLLVILDTFVAVTDPLRYHSRISDCKAWLLIALCWLLSITYGIVSALISADVIVMPSDDLHTVFLIAFFLLLIIVPFLLVILMYWRIYKEARESGQRMRQNGSSPLLQSALNLAATANAHHQQSTILTSPQCLLLIPTSPKQQHHHNHQLIVNKQMDVNDGLTMKIDKQDYCNNNNNNLTLNINKFSNETKTFLLSSPPHECIPMLSGDAVDDDISKSQQHQNILLTLTTVCEQTIKRNHSVKHLLTLENDLSNGHDTKNLELRQVQSSPNLRMASTADDLMMTRNSCCHERTLELPSIQASPKALRYMTSLRHRLSNASSLFKYREEGRAARISILVVIMFLITYLPYGILSLVHGQESIIKESSIRLLSIVFVLLANLISPIIFAYRNKRVRRGCRRLLGVDKKTNERMEKLNSLKRSCSTRIKNYRQNNLHKSFNLGSSRTNSSSMGGIKASNIRRTQSFMTCNYLTPPDAAAKCGVHLSPIHHHSSQQQQRLTQQHVKEKKSILKIVADSSRKFRCQFTNCQTGLNQETVIPTEV